MKEERFNISKMRYSTPEDVERIKADNLTLTGSMAQRTAILSKKHGFSRLTITKMIRNEPGMPKVTSKLTPEEVQRIQDLYAKCEGTVELHKYKAIAQEIGRSWHAVRTVLLKPNPKETKLFNHKMIMF